MSVKEKLSALGLTLPTAAAPVAAYVPAVKSGNLIFTAGQLPVIDGKLVKEGKVGSDVTAEDAKELAQICALNALAAISLVADLDQVERVVRVGGFVNCAPDVQTGLKRTLLMALGFPAYNLSDADRQLKKMEKQTDPDYYKRKMELEKERMEEAQRKSQGKEFREKRNKYLKELLGIKEDKAEEKSKK